MTSTHHTIEKENCTATIIGKDIYYNRFHDNTQCTIQDFQDGYDAFEELTKGKPFKVIVELGMYVQVSEEAREFAQKNEKPAIAEALVIKSLGQRLLVNFYIKFKTLRHPTKAFKKFEDAKNWLDSIQY